MGKFSISYRNPISRSSFLICIIDIFDWIILHWGAGSCLVYHVMISSIPCFSLDVRRTPLVLMIKHVSRHCQMFCGGQG